MFELHQQLASDTIIVGHFELSLVLLHKDSNFPWCILVPRRPGVEEIRQLAHEDQVQLLRESSQLVEVMEDLFAPDKMNIATLGNLVPQLHMHHVARYKADLCWPKPVWGQADAVPYTAANQVERVRRLCHALQGEGFTEGLPPDQ